MLLSPFLRSFYYKGVLNCVEIFPVSIEIIRASLAAQMVKCLPTMRETWVRSLGREDLLEKEWQPTPVLLPGESHGGRSLVGHSPWDHKESDTTEQLHFHSVKRKRDLYRNG